MTFTVRLDRPMWRRTGSKTSAQREAHSGIPIPRRAVVVHRRGTVRLCDTTSTSPPTMAASRRGSSMTLTRTCSRATTSTRMGLPTRS
jgi:hypothetical protein